MILQNKLGRILMGSSLLATLILPSTSVMAKNNEAHAHIEGKAKASLYSRIFGAHLNTALAATTSSNAAPAISGITAPTMLKVGQEGTWTVNASDPENGSLQYAVDWGESSALMRMLSPETSFVQTATFSHSYARAGNYTVKFTVKDENGATSKSSVTVHVADTVRAPVISNLEAMPKTPHSAKIMWQTDLNADSAVWYGTTSPLDIAGSPAIFRSGKVTNHMIKLSRLTPDTTYYVIVRSTAKGGGIATSDEISFTTPALPSQENKAPSISAIDGPSSLAAGAEGTWTLNASDPENGPLSYSVKWGDEGMMAKMFAFVESPFVQTSTFTHTYANPGSYTVTFTVKDEAGASVTGTTSVEVTAAPLPDDVTAPVISDVATSSDDDSISIGWTTDEAATSKVFFGTTSPVDMSNNGTFVASESLTTDHELAIEGLTPSTTYYLRVQSTDASGNIATEDEMSVATAPNL